VSGQQVCVHDGNGDHGFFRNDHSEKHRSPTRNTPQPRAFRGTDAKEFPSIRYWRYGYLAGLKQALALLTHGDATVH
jgi:hypothetical protein